MGGISRRSTRTGTAAAAGMLGFYVVVVRFASGSTRHLVDQLARDWYLVGAVALAFGVQVALFVELRRRHRLHPQAAAAAGAGVGASTAGMIACCAHHLADLAPFLGLAGAATFLYDYRLLFVGVGLAVNTAGIVLTVRRLRHAPRHLRERLREDACAAA